MPSIMSVEYGSTVTSLVVQETAIGFTAKYTASCELPVNNKYIAPCYEFIAVRCRTGRGLVACLEGSLSNKLVRHKCRP